MFSAKRKTRMPSETEALPGREQRMLHRNVGGGGLCSRFACTDAGARAW